MEVKTRGLVLRAVKYGESQLIVDLFTREAGRVQFICRVTRSGRAAAKRQLFQPLTLLDVVYDSRASRSLQRFRDVQLARPYTSIPFQPAKLALSLFLAEFMCYALRGEQGDELLFDYVANSLDWLDSVTDHFANFHLVFMMRLSRFVGFYPNLYDEGRDEWFDLRSGTFSAVRPDHADCLPPGEASRVKLLMRMTFENMHVFRMSREDRNRCTDVVLHYYRLHIPGFPPLKSLPVLRELF